MGGQKLRVPREGERSRLPWRDPSPGLEKKVENGVQSAIRVWTRG